MGDQRTALPERTALVLLAAGQARRFGSPKLTAHLDGRPLVHHAALAFANIPFAYRLCVATQGGVDLSGLGFATVAVEPGLPLSRSVAAGVDCAARLGADAVLIALGDMPRVSPAHIDRLMQRFDGSAVASSVDGTAMPPALFGKEHFARLSRLEGNAGAKALLGPALRVEADASELLDIDTPADLIAAQALGAPPKG